MPASFLQSGRGLSVGQLSVSRRRSSTQALSPRCAGEITSDRVLFGLQAPKPSPGPHKTRECLPLIIMLRNRLKLASRPASKFQPGTEEHRCIVFTQPSQPSLQRLRVGTCVQVCLDRA